jgi:hypothetical protein
MHEDPDTTVNPSGEPPEDDRNEELGESPAPDPTERETSAEDDPQAD